jgi:peroxiredoxin
LRGSYHQIVERGAEVVAIGTGDVAYAKRFVADEAISFRVLVDDDASAARAASIRRATPWGLLSRQTWAGSRRAWRDGHHVHKSGRRVTQLGATFVIGPGPTVHYEHIDADTTDHAALDEVLAALP